MYPITVTGIQDNEEEDLDPAERKYVEVLLTEGLVVTTWISKRDNVLVVQIDTPADGPHENQNNACRVYINDHQIHGRQ